MNTNKKPQGFIFPILVFTMSAIMIASLSMMSIMVIKLRDATDVGNCGMRAEYAADAALRSMLTETTNLASYSNCTEGQYVVFGSGTCALPGNTGTYVPVATGDDCSYAIQINDKLDSTHLSVTAIAKCDKTGGDCAGSNVSVVKINKVITVPSSHTEFASCNGAQPVDSDGNYYGTVWIDVNNNSAEDAGECWMTENLRVSRDTSGKNISEMQAPAFASLAEGSTPDPTVVGSPYYRGYLYTWNAATGGSSSEGVRGICPSGWHLPTDAQWYAIENRVYTLLDGTSNCSASRLGFGCGRAGEMMKPLSYNTPTSAWRSSSYVGKGTAGMAIVGSGYGSGGSSWYQGYRGIFWSSGTRCGGTPCTRRFDYNSSQIERNSSTTTNYYSVRCVRDN